MEEIIERLEHELSKARLTKDKIKILIKIGLLIKFLKFK